MQLSALAYFHRFYAVKDMKNNDRVILSMAALFLACKSEDCQLALNDVIYRFWSHRQVSTLSLMKRADLAQLVGQALSIGGLWSTALRSLTRQ